MSLDQKRARVFGVLFLITFVTSIPALLLYQPVLEVGWGNGLLLGYLMYRSELVPRKMVWLGLVGGPLDSPILRTDAGKDRATAMPAASPA